MDTIVSDETVEIKKEEGSVYIQEALRHSALGKPIMSTTDKAEMAEILSNQFESVFSLADGNEPIFENRTEHLCSEEGIISKFNL